MNAAARRVAVVGSGVAGLCAARALAPHAEVTLFEAAARFGGHAHTVDLTLDGVRHGVDTGFLVFNERTYPGLIRLFDELGVASAVSDMSFSVQAPSTGLEWSGSDLGSVFAQRRDLVSPRFWGMLFDVLRFNRIATGLAQRGEESALAQPVGEFLREHRFGATFRDAYLLPMIGCIWSSPTDQMLRYPIATLIRFCHNHGLLQIADRPAWRTVQGGSREYVERVVAGLLGAGAQVRADCPVHALRRLPPHSGAAGVMLDSAAGSERFDEVVLACHSDQALALLQQPGQAEREILGAIRYRPNRAVLHTDAGLLPRRRRAWAAWNYERAAAAPVEQAGVCLHYWINRLQPLPWRQPVIVSLNPVREPRPASVHGEFSYAHPVFDAAAIEAQRRLPTIQGVSGLWYCGAWAGYGFHEDGLVAGQAVATALMARWAAGAPAWRESA